jgi:hypothetical protein
LGIEIPTANAQGSAATVGAGVGRHLPGGRLEGAALVDWSQGLLAGGETISRYEDFLSNVGCNNSHNRHKTETDKPS